VLQVAKEYWGKYHEEVPEREEDIVDQIAVDCGGSAADHLADCLSRDDLILVASKMHTPVAKADKMTTHKLKKSISAAIEENGVRDVLVASIPNETLQNVYKAVTGEDADEDTSRDDIISRIEVECNKVGVVRFIVQPIFKDGDILKWVRMSGVEPTSNSKKFAASEFYDELIKRVKMEPTPPRAPVPSKGGAKRGREESGGADDDGVEVVQQRPAKRQRLPDGDVRAIQGMCRPDTGLNQPIHWKVTLKNGKEAVLSSTDLIERGPYLLVDYFEKKILGYLDKK
jgi:hypothetical protein